MPGSATSPWGSAAVFRLGVLCLLAIACGGAGGDPPARHVVLVSIDTLRRDHLSIYGYERETSPHLRDLARVGIVFDGAIAANTNTAPSHASMLTGLHPHRHGVLRNGYSLGDGIVTFAQRLAPEYRSAAFVSGYPLQRKMSNLDRGFHHYDDEFGEEQWQRSAGETVDAVEAWLLSNREERRPLFLFVHLYDPHQPYDAPEPFGRRFLPAGQADFQFQGKGRDDAFWKGHASTEEFQEYVRRYDGEIAYTDAQLGRLVGLLKELGHWEHAVLLVTSDHGETLYERPAPFTHGGRVYDEQTRIPMLLRLPGDRFGGARVAAPVHHTDIMPTLLELLDLEPDGAIDGGSLLEHADEEAESALPRPMFSTALPQAWRVPEVGADFDFDILVSSVRTPTWKLIAYPGVDGEILQLFDLERDPGERRDVAALHPEEVATLRVALDSWGGRERNADAAPPPELSPEQEEALRALGYLETGP